MPAHVVWCMLQSWGAGIGYFGGPHTGEHAEPGKTLSVRPHLTPGDPLSARSGQPIGGGGSPPLPSMLALIALPDPVA